jgi:hypothetical protein
MSLGRRLVRRSARRVVRKTVRKTVRTATPRPVCKTVHPANTVKNAVTPRPVKQIGRAAYTVRRPVGAAESIVIDSVFALTRRRRWRRWLWLDLIRFGLKRRYDSASASSVRPAEPEPSLSVADMVPLPPEPPEEPEPSEYVPPPTAPRPAARSPRVRPAKEPTEPAPTSASHAGEIEYQVRREVGLGHPPGSPQPPTTDDIGGVTVRVTAARPHRR